MASQSALVITEVGKPLSRSTRAIPKPKQNEVLVKVLVTGRDLVFGQSNIVGGSDCGGVQQYVILDADLVAQVPSNVSADQESTVSGNLIAPLVSLFSVGGLGILFPGIPGSESFDYKSQTLVVIGGGADTGKLGVQLAHLVGIGRIIAIASLSSEEQLRSFGASHVLDRHLPNAELKARMADIVPEAEGGVVYIFDVANANHTLAVSLLSSTRKGVVAGLQPDQGVDESSIGEKKAGYEVKFTSGNCAAVKEPLGKMFWKSLPGWIEAGKIKPLDFKVIEGGLNAVEVNRVLDEYRDGRNPGRWHVHPNGDFGGP